jgi:DNA-binding transcriptional regulator YdaS (Cro superfamily)
MTKTTASKLFGNATRLAEALGIKPQAISQWPEQLPQRRIDEITGAAFRLGLLKPEDLAA